MDFNYLLKHGLVIWKEIIVEVVVLVKTLQSIWWIRSENSGLEL